VSHDLSFPNQHKLGRQHKPSLENNEVTWNGLKGILFPTGKKLLRESNSMDTTLLYGIYNQIKTRQANCPLFNGLISFLNSKSIMDIWVEFFILLDIF